MVAFVVSVSARNLYLFFRKLFVFKKMIPKQILPRYHKENISSYLTLSIFFKIIISSGYKWRCPTSILATALLVISHPFTCIFAASSSWVKSAFSLSTRILFPICFSITLFIFHHFQKNCLTILYHYAIIFLHSYRCKT